MNNAKSSMIGVTLKNAFKIDCFWLDKSERYPEEEALPEMGNINITRDINISLVNNMETKNLIY